MTHDESQAEDRAQDLRDLDRIIELFNRANELTNGGRYEAALVAAERVLAMCREFDGRDLVPLGDGQPVLARALKLKGKILSETDRPDEALEPLDEAVQRAPDLNLVWRQRGRVLTQLGRWEEAAADFVRALELNDSDAYDWHSLAYTLFKLGRYDEALTAIDEAIKLEPTPSIIGTKGQIYLRLGRYDEALEWLGRALAEDPNDREHWADKALTLRALGREEEARQAEARAAGQ